MENFCDSGVTLYGGGGFFRLDAVTRVTCVTSGVCTQVDPSVEAWWCSGSTVLHAVRTRVIEGSILDAELTCSFTRLGSARFSFVLCRKHNE